MRPAADVRKSAANMLIASDNGINKIKVIKNLSIRSILLSKIFEILLMSIIYIKYTYLLLN